MESPASARSTLAWILVPGRTMCFSAIISTDPTLIASMNPPISLMFIFMFVLFVFTFVCCVCYSKCYSK